MSGTVPSNQVVYMGVEASPAPSYILPIIGPMVATRAMLYVDLGDFLSNGVMAFGHRCVCIMDLAPIVPIVHT